MPRERMKAKKSKPQEAKNGSKCLMFLITSQFAVAFYSLIAGRDQLTRVRFLCRILRHFLRDKMSFL